MGHEPGGVHAKYGTRRRPELDAKQCQALANFELPDEPKWKAIFSGLDFDAMASKLRAIGRPKKSSM